YIGVYESIQKFVGAIVNEGEGYYCLSYESKLKTNVAPLPSVLPSLHIFLPCASTIFFEMNNPRPVPISDSVANIVNSLGKISGPIPIPVSFTLRITSLIWFLPLFFISEIDTIPSLVNLIALVSKLYMT